MEQFLPLPLWLERQEKSGQDGSTSESGLGFLGFACKNYLAGGYVPSVMYPTERERAMPELTAKKVTMRRRDVSPLTQQEQEALKLLRDFARAAERAPKVPPKVPDRSNKYVRPQ